MRSPFSGSIWIHRDRTKARTPRSIRTTKRSFSTAFVEIWTVSWIGQVVWTLAEWTIILKSMMVVLFSTGCTTNRMSRHESIPSPSVLFSNLCSSYFSKKRDAPTLKAKGQDQETIKSPATVWRFCQMMEAMWKGLAKPISQGAPWTGIKHPDGAVFPWNHGFSHGFPPWISLTSGRAGEVTSNGAILQHEAINDQRRAGPGRCGDGYLGEPVFECHLVRF
jgi:hypothetical protein